MNPMFSPLDFMPDAVVLDNGEYPFHPQPLKWLVQTSYIVCCDGATNGFLAHGGKPDVIIGDGDSISIENAKRNESIIHRINEQETNDQTKAVTFLLSQGKNKIVIIGGTGRREDHTLGNISLLTDYADKGASPLMATDYGIFIPCHDTICLKSFKGQQISIFNFGASHLHAEGLVYPLSDFTNWWQGTLNESISNRFTIYATGSYLVFMKYRELL